MACDADQIVVTEDSLNKCKTCTDNCFRCAGTLSTCTQCTGDYALQGTTCVLTCLPFFYKANNLCNRCSPGCIACDGPNANQCT